MTDKAELEKAIFEAQRALRDAEERLGPDDPEVGERLLDFARALRDAGADEAFAVQCEERARIINPVGYKPYKPSVSLMLKDAKSQTGPGWEAAAVSTPAATAASARQPESPSIPDAQPIAESEPTPSDSGSQAAASSSQAAPAEPAQTTAPSSAVQFRSTEGVDSDRYDYAKIAERMAAMLDAKPEETPAEEEEEEVVEEDIKEKLTNISGNLVAAAGEKARIAAEAIEAVAVETESVLGKKGKKVKTSTIVAGAGIAIAVAVAGIGAFVFMSTQPEPEAEPVAAVAPRPKPAAQAGDPQQQYDELTKQIDLELQSTKDYAKLKDLAASRLQAAVELKDDAKIAKSADFVAFTADMLKQPEEALKYYDVHIRALPDVRTLEAKFSLCDRYAIAPKDESELELYKTFKQWESAAESVTLLDYSDSPESFADMLKELKRQVGVVGKAKDVDSLRTAAVKIWLTGKLQEKLERQLAAKQFGKVTTALSDDNAQMIRNQLNRIESSEDLQSNPTFSSVQWQPLNSWTGYRAFVDDTHSIAVIVQEAANGKIDAYRVIMLDPETHVGSADNAFARLVPEFLFGVGAGDLTGFSALVPEIVDSSLKSATPGTIVNGVWTVNVLCDAKGNFLGFEGKRSSAAAWNPQITCKALLKGVNPATQSQATGPEYFSRLAAANAKKAGR